MKDYMNNEPVSEETLRLFIRLLCEMRMKENTIYGLVSMLADNRTAMDELLAYIKENPTATDSQVIKAASTILGIK